MVDLVADEASAARIAKIRHAVSLIRQVQPWRERACIQPLTWILVVAGGGEAYNPQLNACLLDTEFVTNRSVRVIAGMIVHEGTHARLWRRGFRYDIAYRERIERLATEAQADFFSRTEDGAALTAEALASLDREWWGEAALAVRRREQLRAHGFPAWLATVYQRIFG